MYEDRSTGGATPRSAAPAPAAEAADASCGACPLLDLCTREEVPEAPGARADGLGRRQRRIGRGGFVFRVGEPFTFLYVIRRGLFQEKGPAATGGWVTTDCAGPGAVLGFDGIEARRHVGSVMALMAGDVCMLSFDPGGARESALDREVMTRLHAAWRENRRHAVERLRRFRSEQLVASFFAERARRDGARHGVPCRLACPLAHADIARHIGLKVEAVAGACQSLERMTLVRLAVGEAHIPDVGELERFAEA